MQFVEFGVARGTHNTRLTNQKRTSALSKKDKSLIAEEKRAGLLFAVNFSLCWAPWSRPPRALSAALYSYVAVLALSCPQPLTTPLFLLYVLRG